MIFLCILQLSFGQENMTTLYFHDYIEDILYKLPDIQLNKLKLLEARSQQYSILRSQDWQWEMRSGAFQKSDFTGNIDSPFIFQTGWELNTSIKKSFASIGGRMNLEFLYRQFVAKGIVDGITEQREFFVPTLTLEYAQPLLKNAFGILDRFPIAMAGIENKITDWTTIEENSYLLANYKKIYMQWVVYDQIKTFLLESYDNALKLKQLSEEQKRTGYLDNVDYQNTKMLILEIENELLDVKNTYQNLTKQIEILTKQTNIQPDRMEWDIMNMAIQNNDFATILFQDTRQALILNFMKEKLKYSTGALKNARLPELNILLSAAMEVYSTNSVAEIGEIVIIPAFYTGLQLKYPFGDKEYYSRLLQYRKSSLEYYWLMKKYKADFERKTEEKQKNLIYYREKIQNRHAKGKSLKQRYDSQYKKFTQGRETLASLVETRNTMLQTRVEEADMQLRLIFDYFDYLVLNNQDEIALQSDGAEYVE